MYGFQRLRGAGARARILLVGASAAAVFAAVACTLVVDNRIAENGGVDCSGEPDGTSCGTLTICLGGECVGTSCGDGVADLTNGEECDDGNDEGGDGCEPVTCVFSCHEDAECPDADPCDGDEVCGDTSHACEAGALPADGTVACTLEGGGAGQCRMGLCANIDCGDGNVGPGEECDEASPGCAGNCQWVCEGDAECDDGDPCTGTETCDVAAHTCVAGTALDCDDGDGCSTDVCTAGVGCEHAQADGDGDHFAAGTCAADSLYQGGDCDDAVGTTYPGASELCNDVDDDCDEMVDDGIVFINWYPDGDGDGFPSNSGAKSDCQDPNDSDPELGTNYMQPPLDGMGTAQFDCADSMPSVHPQASFNSDFHCVNNSTGARSSKVCIKTSGSPPFYTCETYGCVSPNVKTWDWNCSGTNERQYTATYGVCSCGGGDGWSDGSAPACGVTETWADCPAFTAICCGSGGIGFGPKATCSPSMVARTQACR